MAAGKLLARALSFLSSQSSPLHHLRRVSTAAVAGDLKPSSGSSTSLLNFLRGHGLDDKMLAGFPPHLLDSSVGKHLPAKFDLLLTLGFSVPEAAKVLRHQDLVRGVSLITLRRRLDSIRALGCSDADLRRIIYRASWTLYSPAKIQRMVDNVSKLRGWGVSDAKIKSLLVSQPRFFQLKPQCIDEAADRAEAEFGFRRESKMFVCAVNVLWRISELTRESKFRVFESFGWERSGVLALLKTFPNFIMLAENTLVKKLGFLINEVGYDPSDITKNPAMLGYSLEKRVRPRFQLVNALKSKNLLPMVHALYPTWSMSETKFMEKYVVKFMKEEPGICNAYISTVASPKQLASGFVDQSLSLSKAQAV